MDSKKAGKQRQAQTDAPVHVRRKRMRSRLISGRARFCNRSAPSPFASVTLSRFFAEIFGFPNSVKAEARGKRLGQSRGRSGVKSTIVGVDTKSGFVYVDGVTMTTSDGKEEALPIHPSNLVVTKLYDGDPLRIKRITERSNGGAAE